MDNYYKNFQIETIEDVKSIFPEAEADENNWCIFSTSGVHGTYATLDDLEEYFEKSGYEDGELTILIIRPRIVSMLYSHIKIKKSDIPYLRKLCTSSLKSIELSQKGNIF